MTSTNNNEELMLFNRQQYTYTCIPGHTHVFLDSCEMLTVIFVL